MQTVLSLNPYELGQLIALLPDNAWLRMDADLRNKIKEAKLKVSNSAQDMANLAVEAP